jgi:hypothetical protein
MKLWRDAQKLEERVRRSEEKAAKEEAKRQQEVKTYKHVMKVGSSWRDPHWYCSYSKISKGLQLS